MVDKCSLYNVFEKRFNNVPLTISILVVTPAASRFALNWTFSSRHASTSVLMSRVGGKWASRGAGGQQGGEGGLQECHEEASSQEPRAYREGHCGVPHQ